MALQIEDAAPVDPELLQALAPERRRRVVRVLDGIDALSAESLATSVLADEATAAGAVVTGDRRREVHTSLVHVDLPALDDANVITFERGTGWVSARSTPEARLANRVAETTACQDRTVLEALASERRQAVLRCVAGDETCDVERLARRVVAEERGCDAASVPSDAYSELVTTLHHVHLPKLCEADLLRYDPVENVVGEADGMPNAVTELLETPTTGVESA